MVTNEILRRNPQRIKAICKKAAVKKTGSKKKRVAKKKVAKKKASAKKATGAAKPKKVAKRQRQVRRNQLRRKQKRKRRVVAAVVLWPGVCSCSENTCGRLCNGACQLPNGQPRRQPHQQGRFERLFSQGPKARQLLFRPDCSLSPLTAG